MARKTTFRTPEKVYPNQEETLEKAFKSLKKSSGLSRVETLEREPFSGQGSEFPYIVLDIEYWDENYEKAMERINKILKEEGLEATSTGYRFGAGSDLLKLKPL